MSEDARDQDQRQPPPGAAQEAAGDRRLRVVSFHAGAAGPAGAEPLRLTREYKGPTVDSVLRASPHALLRLPGRVYTALRAIDAGDLAGADRRLDAALNVVPGPGAHRERSLRAACSWLVTLWLLVAAATAIVLTGS